MAFIMNWKAYVFFLKSSFEILWMNLRLKCSGVKESHDLPKAIDIHQNFNKYKQQKSELSNFFQFNFCSSYRESIF